MYKKSLLISVLLLLSATYLSGQKVIDSVKIYNLPVREGIVYKYDFGHYFGCTLGVDNIVTIITNTDSVFHIESGQVLAIFVIENFSVVVIRNAKGEYITYSNLKTVNCKKDEWVYRNTYIGNLMKSDFSAMNSLDVLIINSSNKIFYSSKIIEYILLAEKEIDCLHLITNPF